MLAIMHNTDTAYQLPTGIPASMLTANDRVQGHVVPAHRFPGKRPSMRAERGKHGSDTGITALSEADRQAEQRSCEHACERRQAGWLPQTGGLPATAWASLVIARATAPVSRQTVVRASRIEAIAC